MNGLFDLHLLCIMLRGRSRYMDASCIHPPLRLSDYTSLFCAKRLLIDSALRFVRLTTGTAVRSLLRYEVERTTGNQYSIVVGKRPANADYCRHHEGWTKKRRGSDVTLNVKEAFATIKCVFNNDIKIY